jgi:hypothetical protein
MKSMAAAVVIVVILAGLSCKEPLPEYSDPRDLLASYFFGAYVITPGENAVRVYMTIVNRFDETFDARALLNGSLVITWGGDPTLKKTVTLSPANLIYARGFNPVTGALRFDPGDSIRIGYSWNLTSDDGRSLLNVVPMMADPTCPIRQISIHPVMLVFEGNTVVYERTGPVTPQIFRFEFTLAYQFVDPRNC